MAAARASQACNPEPDTRAAGECAKDAFLGSERQLNCPLWVKSEECTGVQSETVPARCQRGIERCEHRDAAGDTKNAAPATNRSAAFLPQLRY